MIAAVDIYLSIQAAITAAAGAVWKLVEIGQKPNDTTSERNKPHPRIILETEYFINGLTPNGDPNLGVM